MAHSSDEEYMGLLTPEEKEVLAQFKTHSITEGLTDRKLMTFLFARKLIVERAVALLTSNKEFRREHGIAEDVERSQVNDAIINTQVGCMVPNTRDKAGRGIVYFVPSRYVPADYPLSDFYTFVMYLCDQTQWESPDYHRNGITLVEDMINVGFKNLDKRMMKRKKSGVPTLEDIFPFRVNVIFLMHPPWMLRAMLRIAKLLVKQKILKRIKVVSPEGLREHIDEDQLHEDFGGRVKYLYYIVLFYCFSLFVIYFLTISEVFGGMSN